MEAFTGMSSHLISMIVNIGGCCLLAYFITNIIWRIWENEKRGSK